MPINILENWLTEIFGFNGPRFSNVRLVGHCHRCDGYGPMLAKDYGHRICKRCMFDGVRINLAWVTRGGMFMGMDFDLVNILSEKDLPMLWKDRTSSIRNVS
ncbi:MAG: hypothetical protein ACTSPB_26285 [Candidatus Thorarchaeota archaeon]